MNVQICDRKSFAVERKRKQKTFALNGCETGWKNMVNERIWKKYYDKVVKFESIF